MCDRLAMEFQDGWVVNLGIGIPTLCSNFDFGDKEIIFHSENGVIGYGPLAAPGADPNAQTVPAKFSAKNDAEDHLPIIAFTFKNLSDAQKRAIVDSVKNAKTAPPQGSAPPEAYAKPSMQLPASAEVRPLPDAVTAQIPETKGYYYSTLGDKVLLVAPANMTVVAVLGE